MARHRRGCECPQCSYHGGPAGRPSQWESQPYNEVLSPVYTEGLGGAILRNAAEDHPGFPAQDIGPQVTIQNYAAPAAQPQ